MRAGRESRGGPPCGFSLGRCGSQLGEVAEALQAGF